MTVKIVQEQLNKYNPNNQVEEANALKEIAQEIILSALSRSGFFKVGAFQGGTCLRIIYGLNRFSEDLDFALKERDPSFKWSSYSDQLKKELIAYGFSFEVKEKDSDSPVKKLWMKDQSIQNLLVFRHESYPKAQIKIRLEVDTNPPAGAIHEQKYIHFPITVPIICHDLSSLFAGKSHALLCRGYAKGRDWFDFVWYSGQKIKPNFILLANALQQIGSWKGQSLQIDEQWFYEQMETKISELDWNQQKMDIQQFLKQPEQESLLNWNAGFFVDRLSDIIPTYHVRVTVRVPDRAMKSYQLDEKQYFNRDKAVAAGEIAFKQTKDVIMVEVFQSQIAAPVAIYR